MTRTATPRTESQLTTPNRAIEAANGVSYAYRRFGNTSTLAPPLLLFMHFRGNLDNWDPALVDALSDNRELILFDNAGVAGSTGAVPRTFTQMAQDALRFIEALELTEIDVLGYSIGGFVAQELTLLRPRLVRRVILAGTSPQGADGIHGYADDVYGNAVHDQPDGDDLLALFFERSETSVAKGWEFVERIFARTEGRDAPTTLETRDHQLDATYAWGVPDATKLNRLAGIRQPVLVANGDNDRMIPTESSRLLAERLPNAQLRIYPDAGHGFLFQYPTEFAGEVDAFLS
jgi:pimeloyl-ACP methyl ester carboxylesterase